MSVCVCISECMSTYVRMRSHKCVYGHISTPGRFFYIYMRLCGGWYACVPLSAFACVYHLLFFLSELSVRQLTPPARLYPCETKIRPFFSKPASLSLEIQGLILLPSSFPRRIIKQKRRKKYKRGCLKRILMPCKGNCVRMGI